MKTRGLTILIILLMAAGLVACGRKGALELPQRNNAAFSGAPLS